MSQKSRGRGPSSCLFLLRVRTEDKTSWTDSFVQCLVSIFVERKQVSWESVTISRYSYVSQMLQWIARQRSLPNFKMRNLLCCIESLLYQPTPRIRSLCQFLFNKHFTQWHDCGHLTGSWKWGRRGGRSRCTQQKVFPTSIFFSLSSLAI